MLGDALQAARVQARPLRLGVHENPPDSMVLLLNDRHHGRRTVVWPRARDGALVFEKGRPQAGGGGRTGMQALCIAAEIGEALKARGEKIAVAESSSGGLISAALLSVPGASAYYLGGAVVYTAKARVLLTDIPREALEGMRSASEPYALLLARNQVERYGATWGISETGAAGPTGNPLWRRRRATPAWRSPARSRRC